MSYVSTRSVVAETFAGPGSICSIIDRDPGLQGAAISYISDASAVPIRRSDAVIQNHIVITPQGENAPSGQKLRDRLVDFGVDCSLATVGYVAAVGSCGGTAVTFGAAAPLCAISVVGATTGTWKCATSIGKVLNHLNDPNLNTNLEKSDSWYNDFNTVVGWIDSLASSVQIAGAAKNLAKLGPLAARHSGNALRYSRKASVAAYRELADALGETLSNQATKRWINAQGFSLRFSPKVVTQEMQKALRGMFLDGVDLADDAVKAGSKRVLNNGSDGSRTRHTMHILQQAQ